MKLLLDTHAFLWFMAGDSALSRRGRLAIERASNERFLSAASVWEMAIKASLGRLEVELHELVADAAASGITLLPVLPAHALGVAQMPFHDRDPFDRLLVAQSLAEAMHLVSRDRRLDSYGVRRLW